MEPATKAKEIRGGATATPSSVSYSTCVAVFLIAATVALATPFKEYYLGSYVTKSFDEVRDDVVARKLQNLEVITSGLHYFDTFDRPLLPLIDRTTTARLTRSDAAQLVLAEFLVRANVKRSDLLASLPASLLATPVNLMDDLYAPLCGQAASSWTTEPQLLFGNWFPEIRHAFCRDFHTNFPANRFFDHANGKTPLDADATGATLGLIAVVNMSEVYLRHFDDPHVIRKIMKNVQQGYLGLASLPSDYSDEVAAAIVATYATGISLAKVIALLPGSMDKDHIALGDLLGLRALMAFYLKPQQLTMGINVNGEAAILAEVTHATASYFTTDFLVTTVGMHLVSTMHLAPFWDCAIHHTSMAKTLTASDVDATTMQQCGQRHAVHLPLFAVNLMFLFQKEIRDYAKLDNTSALYTLGRTRLAVVLPTPETLMEAPLLSLDGTAWTKAHVPVDASWTPPPPLTPYGYMFTPDCRGLVDTVMLQSGRNVQKYQAYFGDGLGNCQFRDSQETPLQTLCRLFMADGEVLFRALNGSLVDIPRCGSLVQTPLSSDNTTQEIQMQIQQQQQNLRQVEWFLSDTTMLVRRIRIQDNTSRQVRTFLLLLNLVGATYYVIEYLRILKSLWLFVHRSFKTPRPQQQQQQQKGHPSDTNTSGPAALGVVQAVALGSEGDDTAILSSLPPPPAGLQLGHLLYFDPTLGAMQHPGTMALLYLGAVGALSNVFSLVCSANLSSSLENNSSSSIVIVCQPAIALSSVSLLFTSLSCGYWVCQVTLQSRSLAERLDYAAASRQQSLRTLAAVATGGIVIHFACKGGTQYVFENVELRSDPHLYAIVGGLLMSWCIAALFTMVLYPTSLLQWLSQWPKKAISWAWRCLHGSATGHGGDHAAADGGACPVDGALDHCATLVVAQQLEAFHRRQVASNGAPATAAIAAAASGPHITSNAPTYVVHPVDKADKRAKQAATSSTSSSSDAIELHEFVMVHCAAGAASHLETLIWRVRPGAGLTLVAREDPLPLRSRLSSMTSRT